MSNAESARANAETPASLEASNEDFIQNFSAAERFLCALEPNGLFTFITMSDKGQGTQAPNLTKTYHGPFDEDMASELLLMNEKGAGIFVTVNRTNLKGRATSDVLNVRAVFVDLDGADIAPVRAWEIPPHIVVQSSPERWHAYWLVSGLPLDRFKLIQQALARKFGADPSVCDLPRVMRVPGYLHHKSKAVLSTLDFIDSETPPYEADILIDALNISNEPSNSPKIVSGVRSSIEVGHRNTILTSEAGRLRRGGASEEQILALLERTNAECCHPPLPDEEVAKIAKSIARYMVPSGGEIKRTLNDSGNARRFIHHHGERLKFVVETQSWLVWSDGHWKADRLGYVKELAKKTVKQIYVEADASLDPDIRSALVNHANQSGNKPRLMAMLELARTDPSIVITASQLDHDDMLLGTLNGVVDLRTGTFRLAEAQDLITLKCGAAYEPDAKCPTFEAFISRIFGGDDELISYVQRLVGYTLTGRTNEQCFSFLYGTGANGKSTFLEVVIKLMGDYAAQAQPETFTAMRKGGAAASDLARLAGKRAVISNEVCEGSSFEENLLKQLVGGDTVTTRRLYKEEFEFKPRFKLYIAGNHQPIIRGNDDGIWRRVRLIPFTETIPESERDKHLLSKLIRELSGILNWAIAGCLAWRKVGLVAPRAISEATRHYREEMDVLQNWLDEECDIDRGLSVASSELYANHRSWSERMGLKPLSSPSFLRRIESRGFVKKRTRSCNLILGLALKGVRIAG